MSRWGRSGLVLGLAATVASAAAAQPAPLQHVGKWTVRDADDRCVLERDYGAAERPTTLSLTPGTLGTAVILRVVEPHRVEGRIVETDEGSLTLDGGADAGRTLPVRTRSYGPLGDGLRLTAASVRGVPVRDVVLARTLTLERGRAGPPIAIAPGGSAEAVAALERCEDSLLRRQGIDPAAPRPMLSRRPEPADGGTARWFHPADYPRGSTGAMPFGHVVVRAIVEADGRVGACVVAEGSGNRALDAATCAILRSRGRYVPALDESGRPVAAPVVVPVNWEPPRR